MALSRIDSELIHDTRLAFDSVAATYDRSNAANPTLCGMRDRALFALQAQVHSGARVLDLGCGPGCDDETLGRAGYHVTAVDSSPLMVEEARNRISKARLDDRVRVLNLGIQELDRLSPDVYDAVYSSFGPFNCVPDLTGAAALIAGRLRPGGVLVASVIGRLCPWELALYLSRRDWSRARVRFAPGMVPVPLNGRIVWTRYYTPREFSGVFEAAGFRTLAVRGLGLFLPPPYMEAFAARHRRLIALLQRLEDRTAHLPGLRALGDHFLIVMRKQ
jgi:SAM-dependent methyltransferase